MRDERDCLAEITHLSQFKFELNLYVELKLLQLFYFNVWNLAKQSVHSTEIK